MLVLIINLARQMFDYLVPPKRETKTIKTRLLLEKVASYLGYGFHEDGVRSALDIVSELKLLKNVDRQRGAA